MNQIRKLFLRKGLSFRNWISFNDLSSWFFFFFRWLFREKYAFLTPSMKLMTSRKPSDFPFSFQIYWGCSWLLTVFNILLLFFSVFWKETKPWMLPRTQILLSKLCVFKQRYLFCYGKQLSCTMIAFHLVFCCLKLWSSFDITPCVFSQSIGMPPGQVFRLLEPNFLKLFRCLWPNFSNISQRSFWLNRYVRTEIQIDCVHI